MSLLLDILNGFHLSLIAQAEFHTCLCHRESHYHDDEGSKVKNVW